MVAAGERGAARRLSPRAAGLAALGLWLGFVGCLALPRVGRSPAVFWAVAAAAGALGLALLAVRGWAARAGRPLDAVVRVRRPHWVQIGMHSTLFVYWGLHVDRVVDQAALILLQVPLAYLVDLAFSWGRGRPWVLGFGPVPIVGSVNLFLWFKDDFFGWQLGMVALAFAGRELLRWRWLGRERHIFNPSGFALAVMSLGVIALGATDATWGVFISTTPEVAPYMFEAMFTVGLVVMVLFKVTGTTVGAALTVWGLGALYTAATGDWFFGDTAIPIAVFLGMNLLITDPATSPENTAGRLLFGALYGVAVLGLYAGLRAVDVPEFYDKLLQVPLLNLLAPALHRAGAAIEGRLAGLPGTPGQRNLALVGLWIGAFWLLRPGLVAHPGADPSHWNGPCAAGEPRACKLWRHSLEKGCGLGKAPVCHALAEALADMTQVDHDLQRAQLMFAEACRLGHPPSCGRQAVPPVEVTGDPVAVAAACAGGDGPACMQLAALRLKHRPPDRAGMVRALELGCAADHAVACVNLGLMLLRGDGVAADLARGAALHVKACDLGLAMACGRLGSLYASGQGVPRDLDQAAEAWRKACAGGDRAACQRLP